MRGCKAILKAGLTKNLIALFQVKPIVEEEIIRSQLEDPMLRNLAKKVRCARWTNYTFRNDDALLKDKRLCVSHNKALKERILEEAYSSAYVMHLGSTKIYRTWKPIIVAMYAARDSWVCS